MKKFIAFTLAETLIVMGIIGIVSALTLPNLNSSTGEKEKVAKVKKLYRDINDTYGRAQAVYGPVGEWFINDTTESAQKTRFMERMTEFMKVSKYNASNWTATLADGTVLNPTWISASDNYKITVIVDIDGQNKGKNKDGVDRFHFVNKNDQDDRTSFYPLYHGTDTFGSSTLMTSCPPGGGGEGCTRWVIDYDNMDYLKLDSNGKCPNGKALNLLATVPVVSCR